MCVDVCKYIYTHIPLRSPKMKVKFCSITPSNYQFLYHHYEANVFKDFSEKDASRNHLILHNICNIFIT